MQFLKNDAINRVNLHAAVQALAQGAGGLFMLAFLLKSGVSAPLTLCVMAAMTLGRFVLRAGVLPLARRIGVRNTLVLGAVLEAAIFPLLPHVHGPGPMLGLVIVVGAVGSVLYWTSYHAFFAAMGDAEHRGGQTGVREGANALVGIVAPALGGWALTVGGPEIAFYGVAVVQASSALPLIGTPNPPVTAMARIDPKAAWFAGRLQAADGWFGASFVWVWQIALFVALGERYMAYGGALAIAGVASAVASLALGRLVDLGHWRRTVWLVYAGAVAAVMLKVIGFGAPAAATFATAAGALIAPMLSTVMMTRVYNLAKESPCPLRFHMATEAGWDLGAAGGSLAAAALLWNGASFATPLLLAAPAAVVAATMLASSYAAARAPSG